MTDFTKTLQEGIKLMTRKDDDSYDRLSSRYSVAICLVFAALVSGGKSNNILLTVFLFLKKLIWAEKVG